MSHIEDSIVEQLKGLYEQNETARAFLDHAAQRTNNQSETKVDRVQTVLSNDGHTMSRGDIIALFRRLEEIGCGQFVSGRKGWSSRFVWRVGMVEIGRAAAGEKQDIEEIPDESSYEEASVEMLPHSFYLRAHLAVTLDLPADLTPDEAERLAAFIKTLPLDS